MQAIVLARIAPVHVPEAPVDHDKGRKLELSSYHAASRKRN